MTRLIVRQSSTGGRATDDSASTIFLARVAPSARIPAYEREYRYRCETYNPTE